MTVVDIVHRALAVVLPQFRLDPQRGDHGVPHWAVVWRNGRMLDVIADGRVHPVLIYGSLVLVLWTLAIVPFANTPAWLAIIGALEHLSG